MEKIESENQSISMIKMQLEILHGNFKTVNQNLKLKPFLENQIKQFNHQEVYNYEHYRFSTIRVEVAINLIEDEGTRLHNTIV